MPQGRDGPSRITIHRSCDTAPSRAVIRTIAVAVPSAPDPGNRGNGTRSRRPASADKSRGFRKADSCGTAWDRLEFRFLDIRGRNDFVEDEWPIGPLIGELGVYSTKRRIDRCNETFCEDNILREFCTREIAFN